MGIWVCLKMGMAPSLWPCSYGIADKAWDSGVYDFCTDWVKTVNPKTYV